MIKVTKKEAKLFLLKHQNLYNPRQIESDEEIVQFIEKIGCIQYDPLNKVGRNADLVLQSRCKKFSEETLFRLLYEKRELIDTWDKNMSIMSKKDWPYFSRNRKEYRNRYERRAKELDSVREEIREKINEKGFLNSADIKYDQKVNWSWAPTKISRAVLESMYHYGELIIHHKEGTRKYYDFAHKHFPETLLNKPDPNKSRSDFYDWYVKRRIGSIGLIWNKAGDAWLGINNLKKDQRSESIKRLLEKELLEKVKIDGIDDIFYMLKRDLRGFEDKVIYNEASIIAPLDNLMWDRKLISKIFDFKYKWEVYTPITNRKYGYYVLPIIYSDKFIARFEPVIDRKNRELMIKNWWWEDNINLDSDMIHALIRCFSAFKKFSSVEKITVQNGLKEGKIEWINKCV